MPERFLTSSIRQHSQGDLTACILSSAFNAVEPGDAVKKYLNENKLPPAKHVYAFGLGKAACAMANALADGIDITDALIITKHASTLTVEPVTVIEGNHPVPGSASISAGFAAMEFISQLTADDLLVCLISGGGSALMAAPRVSLADLQSLTYALLSCGARIDEINVLRRHLDSLKGGGLARSAASRGARIISLILSDVIDDSLETIASGPTAPDPTTCADALSIIRKYNLLNKIPKSIVPSLQETLKPGDPIFAKVQNTIVASNQIALLAAQTQAQAEGFQVNVIHMALQGEARVVGREIAL
ncbi:MAG: glycerate-2-kinase family protein, partial [Anaerolineales bacterium]|nr:glycerate-2-kinase family protein [Anaerolineales bacterium]